MSPRRCRRCCRRCYRRDSCGYGCRQAVGGVQNRSGYEGIGISKDSETL